MTWFTFLPAVITMALGISFGRAPLPLHPRWAARLLGTSAATTTLATAGTFAFIAVNYLAGLRPQVAARLPEWTLIGDDTPIHALLGIPAIALTCASMLATSRLAARWAAEIRSAQDISAGPVRTDVPIALAVPGRNGGVVVSQGLLASLGPAELEVVFQHERSHLRHRHHRYLALGALAAAALPPLARLNERLRFSLERWADEDAAEVVGDRALVARTIVRVALAHPSSPNPLPGFSDHGVVPRVQALLGAPPGQNLISGPLALAGTGVTTSGLAFTALQLDHALALTLL
jgi:Zn-dependent protease with chaperone function